MTIFIKKSLLSSKLKKIKKWLIELRGKARFFGCFRIETQLNWYVIQQAGELIYRTTANQDDVNSEFFSAFWCAAILKNKLVYQSFIFLVHVIMTGPINSDGRYDFVVLSTNCNYPLYVFARDPIGYKVFVSIIYAI